MQLGLRDQQLHIKLSFWPFGNFLKAEMMDSEGQSILKFLSYKILNSLKRHQTVSKNNFRIYITEEIELVWWIFKLVFLKNNVT